MDENKEVIMGAACVLYHASDSTFIAGSTTDANGRFVISLPDDKDWFLEISCLGYENVTHSSQMEALSHTEAAAPYVFTLREKATELSEVVVKSERPQMRWKNDVMSYNVANVLKDKVVISAFDVLKEMPLIESNDGSSVSLKGAPLGSTVFISGKKTQMSQSQLFDYLKSLPANQVADIEIIYNPSPKWNVRTAVVNVVLKEQQAYTVNGQVQGTLTNRSINSESLSAGLFVAIPKWSGNVTYRLSDSRSREREEDDGLHTVKDKTYEIEELTRGRNSSLSHQVYATLDRTLSGDRHLELTYNGSFTPDRKTYQESDHSLLGRSNSFAKGNSNLHDVALTYSCKKNLTLGVDYLTYRLDNTQQLYNQSADGNTELWLTADSKQQIDRFKAYADMTSTLGKGTLTYGLSYDFTQNSNVQENRYTEETQQTHSETKEYIGKAYVGYQQGFFQHKLTARVSLSGEWYKMADYRNNRLFPNVTLTYKPAAAHTLQANYSTFRNYPSFWQRQDFTSYTNEYKMSKGNPTLRPAKYQIASLVYVLKNKYVLSASYYRVDDFFFSQVYQSPDELVQIQQTFNLDYSSLWTMTLSAPVKIGSRFTSNLSATGTLERFKTSDWHGLAFDRQKWGGTLNARNTWVVSTRPKVQLHVTGMYKLPSIVGLWERPATWMVNAGGSCALLKDCLTISLQGNDLFESLMPVQKVRFDTQYLNSDTNFYHRSLTLNVAYKFKNYMEKRRKLVDSSRYGL